MRRHSAKRGGSIGDSDLYSRPAQHFPFPQSLDQLGIHPPEHWARILEGRAFSQYMFFIGRLVRRVFDALDNDQVTGALRIDAYNRARGYLDLLFPIDQNAGRSQENMQTLRNLVNARRWPPNLNLPQHPFINQYLNTRIQLAAMVTNYRIS